MESLPKHWLSFLDGETEKEYFRDLEKFIDLERKTKTVFPLEGSVFRAFKSVIPEEVKVVILGQDPYHGAGQAYGLAFSVPDEIKRPPSLRNIFKELEDDLGITIGKKNRLDSWCNDGVLLLNATLTVVESNAGSHQKRGWEEFTDAVIKKLAESNRGLIFVLWGSYAQSKSKLIENTNSHIIKSVHPSPLSAYRGFFGSKPFSKVNTILKSEGVAEINWGSIKTP